MASLVLVVGLATTACQKKKSPEAPPPPPASQAEAPAPAKEAEAPAPSRCDLAKMALNHGSAQIVAPEQKIKLERHTQRVIRYNCAGEVTSDQVETVKVPHAELNLKAPKNKGFKGVFVFNEQSCDALQAAMPVRDLPLFGSLSALTGNGKDHLRIKADRANATFTFQFEPGQNSLYVQYFHDCNPGLQSGAKSAAGEATCEKSQDFTIVKYLILVEYHEQELPGEKTVRPEPKSCVKN